MDTVTGVVVARNFVVFIALIQWTMRFSILLLRLGCKPVVRSRCRWEYLGFTSRQRRILLFLIGLAIAEHWN